MKKVLALLVAFLMVLSTFLTLIPKTKAEKEVIELWRVPILDNKAIDGKDSGDVNGDGIEDVAILTPGSTLQIIRNGGTEIWSKSIALAGGSPAISDVDGDGKGEIFAFGRSDFTGAIYCFDDDGTELWQFTDPSWSTGIFGYAAFLNLDSDAQLEIFVTATAGYGEAQVSYALETDGSVMWSFNTPEPGNQMIYTDVTGDGVEEIILATFQKIYVLDKSGSQVQPPIIPHSGYYGAYIMSGDITGDGIDDLAVSYLGLDSNYHNTLYVFKNDGTFLWKKEYDRTGYNLSPPIVIDIDSDGSKEVVVYGGGAIHAYEHDGTELWTWRNSTILPYYCWPGHSDVNLDMKEEIIFEKDHHAYALSLEGTLVMDFALPNNGVFLISGTGGRVEGRETPRWGEVADVNNDGFDEPIIQETIDGKYYVAAVLLASIPSAPRNLVASPKLSSIELTWNDPTDTGGLPIPSFRIYRGLSSGSETLLAAVDGSTHEYVDTSVSTFLYFYYVTAVNSVGEGPPSNEVKCSYEQSFLGIETVVNLESFTMKRSLSNPLGIFTVQQNFEVAVGGSLIHRFWAQNVIEVWPNPVCKSYSLMLAVFEIWESNDGGVTWSRIVAQWQTISRPYRLQYPLILRSTIEDDELIMKNNCKEYNYSLASNSYILGLRSQRQPEIVIVGPPSIPHMPCGTVAFKEPTKGHVDTYTRIGSDTSTWLQCENFLATLPHTGERSKNLKWSTSGDFQYQEGASDQGLFFWPDFDNPIVSPP